MVDDFLIALNPEPDSALPYLLRLPLGRHGVILKAREAWPRTAKVYCHEAQWPAEPQVVERVPVRGCERRGAAIDLVLDRARENRSQFVFTRIRGGREAIFWQSARTVKQARPNVAVPSARAAGVSDMQIVVDVHERYAWKFADQQADVVSQKLPVGDYAVRLAGRRIAVVERKSLQDLVSTLTTGRMRYLQAGLADDVPRAAVVVEDRYSGVFKLDRVRPAVVADAIAEAQARFPAVPIIFAETRGLAQEWTYRFFGAALIEAAQDFGAQQRLLELPGGAALPSESATTRLAAAGPTTAQVRAWAVAAGLDVPQRGRLSPQFWELWRRANPN